jgi:DNA topoisomerase-2
MFYFILKLMSLRIAKVQQYTTTDTNPEQARIAKRDKRSVGDYTRHTLRGQIYSVPDTYIGSADQVLKTEFLFDPINEKLSVHDVGLPEGCDRIFLEILSNAGDNANESRDLGVNPGQIDYMYDHASGMISICNGGEAIPLCPAESSTLEEKHYIPSDIFGVLLTSSNYDSTIVRMGAGRNGYGAKLCNIFSKYFKVEIGDPKNGQQWEGVWTNNMENLESRIVPGHVYSQQNNAWAINGKAYDGPGYCKVNYIMDFPRFGYKEYPQEAHFIFSRHIIDFGFTCKVPVTINGKVFNVQHIKDYSKMFFSPEQITNAIVHYEWKGGVEPEGFKGLSKKKKEAIIANPPSSDYVPLVEIMFLDTPDNGKALSFVNGLMTIDGGVHVNQAYNSVAEHFLDEFNKHTKKKGKKVKKGEKSEITPKIELKDLKAHMSMIISCRLPNTKYKSQTKAYLTSPKPKIDIKEEETRPLGSWQLFDRLSATLDAKLFKSIKKGEKKGRGRVNLDKGIDANNAGGKKAGECVLYIVEGKSAASYPKKRIALTPGNKDLGGYYPLKGKCPNIMKMSSVQLANNKEFRDVKYMLGLREGVTYMDPADLKTLRYGLIVITTDMDSDGTHIRMLLLTFFRKYPGLIYHGKVCYLMTYAVRLFKGMTKAAKCVGRFATVDEYDVWEKANPGHKFRIKYYKGLGTSRDLDIKDDMTNAPLVVCLYDEYANTHIDIAFGEKAEPRKKWLSQWRDVLRTNDIHFQPSSSLIGYRSITNQINTDLVDYTIDTLFRAIPSEDDFIKKVQRQGLYYALHHWKHGRSKAGSMKVNRLAAAAAEYINYHHGPTSMIDHFIHNTQSYVGTNNTPYYQQEGQMGTRDGGGDDAADARYSETMPELWVYQAVKEDMLKLVPRRVVEGEKAEPEFIPFVFPAGVVNGFSGVATGHSTYLPPHSVYDVIEYLRCRCLGLQTKELTPYYRGFNGEVKIHYSKAKKENSTTQTIQTSGESIITSTSSQVGESLITPTDNSDMQKPGAISVEDKEEVEEEFGEEYKDTVKQENVGKRSVVTLGIFNIIRVYDTNTADVIVSELPIGSWIENYHKWLQKLEVEGSIESFKDNSTTDNAYFTITKFTNPKGINHSTLRLKAVRGYNNITLISTSGYPTLYNKVEEVIDKYMLRMLALYEVYRLEKIKSAKLLHYDCAWKIEFIKRVISNDIRIMKVKVADVYTQMDKFKIPHEYYKKVKIWELSAEKIEEFEAEIVGHLKKIEEYEVMTPYTMWVKDLQDMKDFFIKDKYDLHKVV